MSAIFEPFGLGDRDDRIDTFGHHTVGRGGEDMAAWITLRVHSALDAVGLTAAVSLALTDAGLSCNVVAGFHHDHVFVPYDRAAQAVDVLKALAAESG